MSCIQINFFYTMLDINNYIQVPIWILALVVFGLGILLGKALFEPQFEPQFAQRTRSRPPIPPEPNRHHNHTHKE